jgi:hypothetical protein
LARDYAVCVAQPPGYAHSGAFIELAELVAHGLADLGHNVTAGINQLRPGATPILIGCHLLTSDMMREFPDDTIVLNTEQVHDQLKVKATILEWVKRFETWDYSASNIEVLSRAASRPVRLLRIGYHPALARITSAADPDIDVLFYGSRNERRRTILRGLADEGVKVHSVYGVYGAQRDALVARSKIVLNMHYYDTQIFEIVRVFYLLTNRKAVVSEINARTAIDPAYREGVAGAAYDALIGTCISLLGNESERRALEEKAFSAISSMPQRELLKPLLAG